MAIVEVLYKIPVGVIIDTDSEEIKSVLEFGDLIELEDGSNVVNRDSR
jgi:hypothetical protein